MVIAVKFSYGTNCVVLPCRRFFGGFFTFALCILYPSHMSKRFQFMNSFLFKSLILLALALPAQLLGQSADLNLLHDQILRERIEAHTHFVAHDLLEGRDTPSRGQDVAAIYIASHLHQMGLKSFSDSLPDPNRLLESYFQKVPLQNVIPADEGMLSIGGEEFFSPENFLQLSGGNVDIKAKMVYVNYGSEADFEGTKVKDKIVLARGGNEKASGVREMFIEGRDKARRAEEAGAKALVEFYNSPQTSWSMLQFYLNTPRMTVDEGQGQSTFPRFWVEDVGNRKRDNWSGHKKEVSIRTQGAVSESLGAQNVIAYLEGTDPVLKDEYIVLSAHYDHVGIGVPDADGDSIYNGTRDNAIGTVTLLEAARVLSTSGSKRSIIFAFFCGEEKGLLGSEYFVSNPPVPLRQMAFCLNSDNAGYNDTTKATVIGLERTSAENIIREATAELGLEAIVDPVPRQNLFDRSDQVNFARKGVPAVMYSMGLTSFDEEIMKYYHRPSDNPGSVDYDYLLRFTKAYVLTAMRLANTSEAIEWRENDRYFEASRRLYGL